MFTVIIDGVQCEIKVIENTKNCFHFQAFDLSGNRREELEDLQDDQDLDLQFEYNSYLEQQNQPTN